MQSMHRPSRWSRRRRSTLCSRWRSLTSRADGQSGHGRAFLTRLTQSTPLAASRGLPNTRTVPQTDTVPADAPLAVEVTTWPPTPAAAPELRRWLCRGWRRRPVDQFIPAVPDGLIAACWPMALRRSSRFSPPAAATSIRAVVVAHRDGVKVLPRPASSFAVAHGAARLHFPGSFRCVVWSQPDLRARSFVLRPRLLVIGARLDECPLRREKRQPCLDDPVQLPLLHPRPPWFSLWHSITSASGRPLDAVQNRPAVGDHPSTTGSRAIRTPPAHRPPSGDLPRGLWP